MQKITLLTGGIKSGKSTRALELAQNFVSRAFIATAEAFDDEMRLRIECHKAERADDFTTFEEPLDLARALKQAWSYEVVVVDCLTVWVNNLMYHRGITDVDSAEIGNFLDTLETMPNHVVLVTNETNLGFTPMDKQARLYGDILGLLNQQTARLADEVFLMVSGLPLKLK